MVIHSRLVRRCDATNMFRRVGLPRGASVMVHSSLRDLGYLINGAVDVIEAILEVIGPHGTLLAPAHSGGLTDPADWSNPAVPEAWWDVIRTELNPFNPDTTPVRNRGILAEALLRYPNVHRSNHPISSVAALGKKAEFFTCEHPLHAAEGVGSPYHKLYYEDGYVLLLGVGLDVCTAIHTAEFLADCSYLKETKVKVLATDSAQRQGFVKLERYPGNSTHFLKMEPELAERGLWNEFFLEHYRIACFPLRPAIELALERLAADETYLTTP